MRGAPPPHARARKIKSVSNYIWKEVLKNIVMYLFKRGVSQAPLPDKTNGSPPQQKTFGGGGRLHQTCQVPTEGSVLYWFR